MHSYIKCGDKFLYTNAYTEYKRSDDEVVLSKDDAFFSGDKMSDIYVKGWLTGPEDSQVEKLT